MQANSQTEKIAEIFDAVKQREEEEKVIEVEEPQVQCVVILLDEKYYAFYGECIKEVVVVHEIAFVPGMPDYIPGVIHIRGEIESVLDLRRILGLAPVSLTKRSRIMIGQVNNVHSGILVDSVEDVLELPESDVQKPVSALDSEITRYIIAESMYKNQELIILDVGKIFEILLRS